MSATYEKCPPEVQDLLQDMMKKHHPALAKAEALVLCLFADAGEDQTGEPLPAVKVHGHPCAAKVKIVCLADRAAGMPDAVVTIDKRVWLSELSEKSRLALLDHELEHLMLKQEEGDPVLDDLGRPTFEMRKHDWELSGFGSIIERHGEEAVEMMAIQSWSKAKSGQMVFKFMSEKRSVKQKAA